MSSDYSGRRRPEVVLLSPSPESEDGFINDNEPSTILPHSPGRPLARSPMNITYDILEEGSFASPVSPALNARQQQVVERAQQTAPPRALSPEAESEADDAEPLFLASVARAQASRIRRRGIIREEEEDEEEQDPLEYEMEIAGIPHFGGLREGISSSFSAPSSSLVSHSAPFNHILSALNNASERLGSLREAYQTMPEQTSIRRFRRHRFGSSSMLLDDALANVNSLADDQGPDQFAWLWDHSDSEGVDSSITEPQASRPASPQSTRNSTVHAPSDAESRPSSMVERALRRQPATRYEISNPSHIHQSYQVRPEHADVYQLCCSGPGCGVLVCSRAFQPKPRLMRATAAARSDMKFERRIYSTDAPPPDTVTALPETPPEEACGCERVMLGCTTCGQTLGYHLVTACPCCAKGFDKSPTPGQPHPFHFHQSAVKASLRLDEKPIDRFLRWHNLPSLQDELAAGRISDPVEWYYLGTGAKGRSTPYWWPSKAKREDYQKWITRAHPHSSWRLADMDPMGGASEDFKEIEPYERAPNDITGAFEQQKPASESRIRDRRDFDIDTPLPPTTFGMLAISDEGTEEGSEDREAKRRKMAPVAGR